MNKFILKILLWHSITNKANTCLALSLTKLETSTILILMIFPVEVLF